MEYQKIIKFLNNNPNQPSKFKAKRRVEINDGSCGLYSTGHQIKFKTSMIQ